jgi:hypothetical protein
MWSLTLKEEHKLRVFANRVLRRIFGPKRKARGKEATGRQGIDGWIALSWRDRMGWCGLDWSGSG